LTAQNPNHLLRDLKKAVNPSIWYDEAKTDWYDEAKADVSRIKHYSLF
jgi:hypothetical protein